tara:strand:+ start:255 stop:836 length:582 start_codon:yes stop_codon:yes gene_type:complete
MPDPRYSNRIGYAPWSLTREAGVQSATVNGTIDVPQFCQPTINTGVIDEKGNWQGVKASDNEFIDLQRDLAIADNAEILSNKVIDLYGFSKMNIAINVSRAGNYFFELILGGDVNDSYLNLNPIYTNLSLRGTVRTDSATNTFISLLSDQENLVANVWNVFQVNDIGDFKAKMKITNQSGGNSNIQTAIQRLV